MNLHAGINGAKRSAPQIIDSLSCSPDQHNLVFKGTFIEGAAENIADGNMGKGFLWAKVVYEELTIFIGGDKSLSNLNPFNPIAVNLDHELRSIKVLPNTR